MTVPKVLYTATAHATGDGRNDHATTDDGRLDLDLRIPGSPLDPSAVYSSHSRAERVSEPAAIATTPARVRWTHPAPVRL